VQSTAYKPYETRRHVGRSLFEWVSTSRLPLNSQEAQKQTQNLSEWRPGIACASVSRIHLPFQPFGLPSRSLEPGLSARFYLGRAHSLPLLPGAVGSVNAVLWIQNYQPCPASSHRWDEVGYLHFGH
jgi:hypothetical protein